MTFLARRFHFVLAKVERAKKVSGGSRQKLRVKILQGNDVEEDPNEGAVLDNILSLDILDHDLLDATEPGLQTAYFPGSEKDGQFPEGQIVTLVDIAGDETKNVWTGRQARVASMRDARMVQAELNFEEEDVAGMVVGDVLDAGVEGGTAADDAAAERRRQKSIAVSSEYLTRVDMVVQDTDLLEPLERYKLFEAEAQERANLYNLQLQELLACTQLLQQDQERYAQLMQNTPSVGLTQVASDLVLFKQGLDLRIQELEEDSRRILKTERSLTRAIFFARQEYELALLCSTGLVSSNQLLKRVRQQERVLRRQQFLLDTLRFDRDVAADEVTRLRRDAYSGEIPGLETVAVEHEVLAEEGITSSSQGTPRGGPVVGVSGPELPVVGSSSFPGGAGGPGANSPPPYHIAGADGGGADDFL